MKKRLLSMLLVLCALASLLSVSVSAQAVSYRDSGCSNVSKMTQKQMATLLQNSPNTMPSSDQVFVEKPSCTAPYTAGKLTTSVLNQVTARLNALRRIAGLSDVSLDLTLCEQAQYGAVIQAANGGLSHTPSKPADMDDAFYQAAYAASSSSNLYAGRALTVTPDGFMDDTGIATLGHRRWQLNPYMGKVGFGYAESGSGYGRYTAEKVFDSSGTPGDFEFIAWPASGNFPSTLINYATAWSVSLNTDKFTRPAKGDLTVTLKRASDGQTWTFDANTTSTVSYTDDFFDYNTGGYGVSNCIIFHPSGIDSYDGVYTVTIQGIRDMSGNAVDFAYQVNFFNPADALTTFAITSQPSAKTVQGSNTTTFHVDVTGDNLKYQWQYRKPDGSWTDCTNTTKGYNTATLTVQGVTGNVNRNGYQYRCKVTSGSSTIVSNAATLTVFAIRTQPAAAKVTGAGTTSFSVDATGSNLKYQWQYKMPSGSWTDCTSKTKGYHTATLTVQGVTDSTNRNGYQYRCKVTSGSSTIVSNAATLTVFAIKMQPKAVTAAVGDTATFKVVATGSGLKYQWQYKTPTGSWTDCTGKTKGYNTATLKVSATAARSGYQYRCKVTSGSQTLTTTAVKLTVKAIVIQTQPTAVSTTAGKTATFQVVASGSSLKYQWQYKTPTGSWTDCTSKTTGYNTATLKVSATAARSGYQYRCVITSGSSKLTSNAVKLTVK